MDSVHVKTLKYCLRTFPIIIKLLTLKKLFTCLQALHQHHCAEVYYMILVVAEKTYVQCTLCWQYKQLYKFSFFSKRLTRFTNMMGIIE